jgi:two-component system chemotaxis response regulator CheB
MNLFPRHELDRGTHCVVAIGASAGGVQALKHLFSRLSPDTRASFLVVLHIPPHTHSHLDEVLQACTTMPVRIAKDGETLRPGTVYVAKSDLHLMVTEAGRIKLTRGPKECRTRPAVDVLFRSVATVFGARSLGIVLSGMLDDGTAGLWAIKERNGLTLVQDPAEAENASMPQSAIDHVEIDLVGPVDVLARELPALINQSMANESAPPSSRHVTEAMIAGEGNALQLGVMKMGEVSQYTCPDCHGVLVHIKEGRIVRFRCHTGHAFSMKTLLEEVSEAIDNGLWDTIRAVEERILLLREMAEIAQEQGSNAEATACEGEAREAERRITAMREMVLDPSFFGRKN